MNIVFRAIRKGIYLCSGPITFLGKKILRLDRYITEYSPAQCEQFNSIVIFGAGLLWRTGEPSPVLRDRLNLALQVRAESGRDFIFLCSGEGRGPEYDEPEKMKEYLCARGVPEQNILLDKRGVNTSATISRLPLFGIDHAIMITNDFHMPRVAFLASKAGLHFSCVSVHEDRYLKFRETLNREGLAQWKDVLKYRLTKLKNRLKSVEQSILPSRLSRFLQYAFRVHRVAHLIHPKTFTEKVVYDSADPRMSQLSFFADKVAVRSYVADLLGEEHLVPLCGILKDSEEFLSCKISDRVFIKPNNASGRITRFDPDCMSREPICTTIRQWQTAHYNEVTGEQQYAPIPFRILLEKDLRDISPDYRMLRAYCYNGSIEMMYITSDTSRDSWQLTKEFQPSPFSFFHVRNTEPFTPPAYYREVLEGIETLSRPFPFVRVDIYLLPDRWMFSELTFTPHRGLMRVKPAQADLLLGQKMQNRHLWEIDTTLLGAKQAEHTTSSVIVISHNRKEKLQRAIDSVLAQTVLPGEILVMDTGSTDGTEQMIQAYSDPRIQFFSLSANDSAAVARNRGIEKAVGEYVFLLDDDDWWEPNKMQKQLEAAFCPGMSPAAFVYTGTVHHYNGGRTVIKTPAEPADGDLSSETIKRMVCTSSTMMIRRDLLMQIGGFDETLSFWQDTELLIRLSPLGRAKCVREALTHIDTTSSPDSRRLSDQLPGWERSVAYINEKHHDRISALAPKDLDRRLQTIYEDGVRRCDACGNRSKRKDYWTKLWNIRHRPAYFIPMLFNLSPKWIYLAKAMLSKLKSLK